MALNGKALVLAVNAVCGLSIFFFGAGVSLLAVFS